MTTTGHTHWETIVGHLVGYQATWIADIGLKAGLFEVVATAGDGISEEELAARLGHDRRLLAAWCRSAYAFELLDWDPADGYRLPAELRSLLLDPTDPLFIGGRIRFIAALHEDFRAYPAYLPTGGTWPRSEHDPSILQALENATKADSAVWTEVVLPQAPETLTRLEAGGRLLDVGAGAGSALLHYARRFPRSRIVGIELDEPSLALARHAVADAGLDDRVEVRHGDANHLDDHDAYDLVTMNVTLHETGGPDEYHNVLTRTCRAMKPGGTLLVAELPYPDSPQAYRQEPAYRMLAGVQIHETLVGCGAITQGQLPTLVQGAGLTNVRVAQQPMPTRFVVLADKPA